MAAGWFGEWSTEERDEIDSLAAKLDREIQLYPVIHAWRTNKGSQLTFWCTYCKDHHVHGRHIGDAYVRYANNKVLGRLARNPQIDWLYRAYVRKFASCKFNDRFPGGRGVCTCPFGSGDGHRVAHCWKTDSAYWRHGYILHEVETNDVRALQKPKRTGNKAR